MTSLTCTLLLPLAALIGAWIATRGFSFLIGRARARDGAQAIAMRGPAHRISPVLERLPLALLAALLGFALSGCIPIIEEPADVQHGASLGDRLLYYVHEAAQISPWWLVALLVLLVLAWVSSLIKEGRS